jgi:hypothetical protein
MNDGRRHLRARQRIRMAARNPRTNTTPTSRGFRRTPERPHVETPARSSATAGGRTHEAMESFALCNPVSVGLMTVLGARKDRNGCYCQCFQALLGCCGAQLGGVHRIISGQAAAAPFRNKVWLMLPTKTPHIGLAHRCPGDSAIVSTTSPATRTSPPQICGCPTCLPSRTMRAGGVGPPPCCGFAIRNGVLNESRREHPAPARPHSVAADR